jgi:hypothetical protein
MKKSALILISLFSSCVSMAQTNSTVIITPHLDTVITQQTVKPYIIPVVQPPLVVVVPPVGNFTTLNAQEQLMDVIHFAYGSLGFDGTKYTSATALNNQEVGKINNAKGSIPLPYVGTTVIVPKGNTEAPLDMDGKIPILISDDGAQGKWLAFKNQTFTTYESVPVDKSLAIKPPYETNFVFRYLPGQSFEALFEGGGNCGYVGDLSSNIRIINPNYGVVPNSTFPSLYVTHIGRLVINSQSSASWYLDGTFVGTVQLQAPDLNNMGKLYFNVGVVTHQSDWDFAAMYFKKSILSDADYATWYGSVSAKWGVGTIPNQILLSNIAYSKGTSVYTPTAAVINTPKGVTVADPSKWDYQWYTDDGSLNNQKLISTAYQLPVSLVGAGLKVKVLIRPKDTNGNVWRYFEGTYPN